MSRCAELMDIGRAYGSYEAGCARIQAQTLLIGVEQDVLIHHSEMRRLHEHIPNSRLEVPLAVRVCGSVCTPASV